MIHLQFYSPEGRLLAERSHLKCPLTIGSSKSADIRINDDTLSPFHAQITLDGSALIIQDIRSTHGLYRDGKKQSEIRYSGEQIEFYLGRIGVRLVRSPDHPVTKMIPDLAEIVKRALPQKTESFWHRKFEKNLLRSTISSKALGIAMLLSTLLLFLTSLLSENTEATALILNLVAGIGLSVASAVVLSVIQYFLHKQTRFWEAFAISYILLVGLISPLMDIYPAVLYNLGPNFFTLSVWQEAQFIGILTLAFLAHSYLFQQSRRKNLAFFYVFLWTIPLFVSAYNNLKAFESSSDQRSISRKGAAVMQITYNFRSPAHIDQSVDAFISGLDKKLAKSASAQTKKP